MSANYVGIIWNRQVIRYDLVFSISLLLIAGMFIGLSAVFDPNLSAETMIVRTSALLAVILLHVILVIGPLARLQPRLLPLLYNRRHLGVSMFLLALVHGVVVTFQYHALGDANPLVSIFTAYRTDYGHVTHTPFEAFGFFALLILFLMAATSHDFWLKTLGASLWKLLHLGVYVAWGLILVHVALGLLQSERSPLLPILMSCGVVVVSGLHLYTWWRERSFDRSAGRGADGAAASPTIATNGRREVDVGAVSDLAEGEVMPVVVAGERLAVCRHQGQTLVLHGVCRHQGGPLGEGRIIDGCLTCPWHGWQYQPGDGTSPPPFAEVVRTYPVRIEAGRILVNPEANPLATPAVLRSHP